MYLHCGVDIGFRYGWMYFFFANGNDAMVRTHRRRMEDLIEKFSRCAASCERDAR